MSKYGARIVITGRGFSDFNNVRISDISSFEAGVLSTSYEKLEVEFINPNFGAYSYN